MGWAAGGDAGRDSLAEIYTRPVLQRVSNFLRRLKGLPPPKELEQEEAKEGRGFNYVIAPNKLPLEQIVCGVENIISILEPNTAETLRQKVCTILRNIRPPKKNISTEELKALIGLKQDENIIHYYSGPQYKGLQGQDAETST
ncbi:hypothetical protein Trydic_g20062 [Trypoxylus dichotomus]